MHVLLPCGSPAESFFQVYVKSPQRLWQYRTYVVNSKSIVFIDFILSKLIGSGTHYSKIDGFPGTHGTHANGATG